MADLIHFVDDIDVVEILNIVEDNEDIQSYFDDDMNEVRNLQRIMNIICIFVHSWSVCKGLDDGLTKEHNMIMCDHGH